MTSKPPTDAELDGEGTTIVGTLELYMTPYCGYCHRVIHAAGRLGVELTMVDIWEDRGARTRLLEARGRTTVPVLAIPEPDGGQRLMPESRDIIAFLEALASGAEPSAIDAASNAAASKGSGGASEASGAQTGKAWPATNWLSSIVAKRRK